ncbi:amidohydrolase family protein [Pseudoalteromonas denitrificans]|uniref:Predicted metal-dependent hydrolase, TIM-barrel fold n=1 Tax=Pseudoalteromonas denitrificans DSM 6059 TaxID=1123010 RepID=A0A1I1JA37_9GAMM|nr:amidohydrolase family protein [Pseudoalteromonas denitrificans]SFC44991.1 Predicted metal-dependent hydrolase, TIM-barrel fold [Pseudoalteromonas denitrificans DSM 6059]
MRMQHKIIDPHLHFFDLSQGQYHWLKNQNPPYWPDKHIIQKNFNEHNLILNDNFTLEGIIHIEAGFNNDYPVEEINFLNKSIRHTPFKAISFIDMTLPLAEFSIQLLSLKKQATPALIGIRHIMEGDDIDLLFSKNLIHNLKLLASNNLIFEAQFELNNIKATQQLAEYAHQIPNLTLVINHCGLVCENNYIDWQQAIGVLSNHSNIYIKCSGWEMNNRQYKQDWLQEVITYLIKSLSFKRVMLASNFPLCLFSKSYAALWQSYLDLNLKKTIWQAISYTNAKSLYQIKSNKAQKPENP